MAAPFVVTPQVILLLGHWHELLHGDCQAEGCKAAVGHADRREVPAQERQVIAAADPLPDLRMVPH